MLDAWSKVRGVGDAVLQFRCEPGCDEVADMCAGADFAERQVAVNPERLGAAANTKLALDEACAASDYAILRDR